MAAELGYEGGKTIFDDYVREVRPRFQVKRTFQRTIYRPGELVQCDLSEPREPIAVGHGQTRRGWVVIAELCWSRVIAGQVTSPPLSGSKPASLGSECCLQRRPNGSHGSARPNARASSKPSSNDCRSSHC
jgi:hypothetical protein